MLDSRHMPDLLQEAIEVLKELPSDRQKTVAHAILNYAGGPLICTRILLTLNLVRRGREVASPR
jgi:hypothetical protein